MAIPRYIPVFIVINCLFYRGIVRSKICNVALCRPTLQSSLYSLLNSTVTSSCNAVDGIRNTNINSATCMQTNEDYSPESWWQVDLGSVYSITHVNITMREDGIDNYKMVGDTSIYGDTSLGMDGRLTTQHLCANYWSGPFVTDLGKPLTINCVPHISVRYVEIIRYAFSDNFLSFCEMEVFADVTATDCPYPPGDWSCRNLHHRTSSPIPECVPGYVPPNPTTESLTTIEDTTTEQMTTNPSTVELTTTEQMINNPTTVELTTTEQMTNNPTTVEFTTIEATTTTTEKITTPYITANPTTEGLSAMQPTTTDTLTTTTEAVILTSNADTTTTIVSVVTSVTSTNIPSSNNSSDQICYCPCSSGNYLVLTDAELQRKIEQIIIDIKIDPKKTSYAKRKLISVEDNRPSAKAVGSVGVAILVCCAGFIFVLDSDIIVKNIGQCRAKGNDEDNSTADQSDA